jgi:hypothetical protein
MQGFASLWSGAVQQHVAMQNTMGQTSLTRYLARRYPVALEGSDRSMKAVKDSIRVDEIVVTGDASRISLSKGAMPMKTYDVTLTFETEMLGTAPANPEVYSNHIAIKKNRDLMKAAVLKKDTDTIEKIKAEDIEIAAEEAELLPQEDKGITVIRRDEQGLLLMDFMIRGFLKESAEAVNGGWGIRSKIDKWMFVTPRKIYLQRDGEIIKDVDGTFERPLRAQTMQGPRVTLAKSEQVNPGCTVSFKIHVLPLGEKGSKESAATPWKFDLDTIKSWLDYGQLSGIGQFRTGSYGRFTYTIKEVKQ